MNDSRVLLVEDEPGLVLTLTDLLASEGYRVEHAGDVNAANASILAGAFDILVLDLMLPGGSGLDVLRDMRARGDRTPVLVLTARATVPDKVAGLKLGADDYLSKPFDSLELLARMEALVRRSRPLPKRGNVSKSVMRFGDIDIDQERSEARKGGIAIALTVQEYRLLVFLMAHEGQTLSRDRLLEEVWGYDLDVASRTVDVHISSLRQKIGDDPARPRWIVTVRGFGYRFERAD